MKQTAVIFLFLLGSCIKPSYYQTQQTSLNALYENDFAKSLAELEKNEYLKVDFNANLYQIEKGRLLFLMGKYEEASKLLIEAELSMEDWKTFHYRNSNGESKYIVDKRYTTDGSPLPPPPAEVGDLIAFPSGKVRGSYGYTTVASYKSPRKLNFICNDYERPLINFYVGLCGVQLRDDKPMVEAKRLNNLMENLDTRKFAMNPGQVNYATNPFIPLTSGIFYESMGDYNNALIEYEKAVTCFEDKYCYANYGVNMPTQLLIDVLSILKKLGFSDRIEIFTKKYPWVQTEKTTVNNTVILLVEEGFVPPKDQEVIWYYDGQPSTVKIKGSTAKTQSTATTRVIIRDQNNMPANAVVGLNQNNLKGEAIMNFDYGMKVVLRERLLLENVRNSDNVNGSMMSGITNHDTRNWQNLPAKVYYYRVPLSSSANEISISYYNIKGEKKMQKATVSQQAKTQVLYFFLN